MAILTTWTNPFASEGSIYHRVSTATERAHQHHTRNVETLKLKSLPDAVFNLSNWHFGPAYCTLKAMRIISRALVLLILCTSPTAAQKVFFFPEVADGILPGVLRYQTTFIFVNTGATSEVTVEFFKSPGDPPQVQPMQLTLVVGGIEMDPSATLRFTLGQGEAFVAQSTGTVEPPQVGYAVITATPGEGVGGTAVFTQSDPDTGILQTEAGVPASQTLTSFSLFVDSIGVKDTGLAMINPPGGILADLNLTLYDKLFNLIATTPVPLAPGQHIARFIKDFFPDVAMKASEMEGTVTVESAQPIAAVTLRLTDDFAKQFPDDVPILTTFPVVPGVAQATATGSFSLSSRGEISVTLNLSSETRVVIGVIYRIYHGDTLVQELTRGISSSDQVTQVLLVEEGQQVSHVEAKLIYAGGHLSSRLDLPPE